MILAGASKIQGSRNPESAYYGDIITPLYILCIQFIDSHWSQLRSTKPHALYDIEGLVLVRRQFCVPVYPSKPPQGREGGRMGSNPLSATTFVSTHKITIKRTWTN